MKKLILDARSSGNIQFGLTSPVRGVGSRTTVADIGLSAAAEVIIPGLTIKDVISPVPDEDVITCASQDNVSPICAAKPISAVSPEDAVITALGVHIIVPCGSEEEIVGVCAVASSDVDEIDPGTLRRLEVVCCDWDCIDISVRSRYVV